MQNLFDNKLGKSITAGLIWETPPTQSSQWKRSYLLMAEIEPQTCIILAFKSACGSS